MEDVIINNEANKKAQKKDQLPAVNIRRTHEINDLVSKEELALILSNDFLFGDRIEIDQEKLKQIHNQVKKRKNKQSDLAPGHDGLVERPLSASQIEKTGSPGNKR